MLPVVQIVLFAFLGLTSGEALRCIHCIPKDREGTCDLKICEVNPATGTCHALTTYSYGTSNELILQDTILDCKRKKDAKCGIKGNVPGKRIYVENSCCEDSDLCNGKK